MTRSVAKQANLLVLHDDEYPITFSVIKSGHLGQYLVIDEDPFDHGVKLKNTDEVMAFCRTFDPAFTEQELPKMFMLEVLPKDSERKMLARLDELLTEEWKSASLAMEELERDGDDESSDYGEMLGVRAIIRKVRDCIEGNVC